jgi:hypothetical protein
MASLYSEHPSLAMERAMVGRLEGKTGRSIEGWIAHIKKGKAPVEPKELREWLKGEGLTTNYAWMVADYATGGRWSEAYDPDALVEKMYGERKAGLRPIHNALVKLGLSLGKDVKICPCETIVPFYRKHVFAQIKPSTNTRIDFGYALGDMKPSGRLIDTGGFQKKDRITHRIPITQPGEIDAEVKKWLREAYERDGV